MGIGYSTTGMILPGGGYLVQLNPLHHHQCNFHVCGWRGAIFGLVEPHYQPDPCLFYKEGIRNEKGFEILPCCLHVALPIKLKACPHLLTQLPDEALGLTLHRHLRVRNYPRLLGNPLFPLVLPGGAVSALPTSGQITINHHGSAVVEVV